MQYFDFHTHVILKQLFNDNPSIDARISRGDVGGIPKICTDLPNIIETQIHQSQLAGFQDEVLVGAVLYGLESYIAREVIPLRKYLKQSSQHKLSLQILNDVVANNMKSFKDFVMSRTLEKYLNSSESFNIVDKSSFNGALPKNKVNVFFVIEGCHSLVDSFNEFSEPDKVFPPAEIIKNLDAILQKVKVVSVNPTHMQQSNLCNHAFGMQLANSKPFYPRGNGLQDDGRKVIQELFNRGICVDLKHMSYKSREDLRNEIDQRKFQNVQPLLCTHAGFTGIPFADWPGYIALRKPVSDVYYLEIAKTMQTKNQPARPGAPAFNMTSINLFNEEIVWIVRHGGLIGVSMDRRIIGYVDKFDDRPTGLDENSSLVVDKEYISKNEWRDLKLGSNIGKLIDESDCVMMSDLEESTEVSIPARDEYFFDHVLLHLKHYFQVCFKAGIAVAEAQKHVTIGSDFDGLINPFLNIPTVDSMRDLKKYIQMNFRFYLRNLTDSSEWADQLNVNQFVEDLFYNNGYNFIKAFFQKA